MCLLTKRLAALRAGTWRGCGGGKEAIWAAALNWTLLKSNSIGRRLAWDSRTSLAVVLREPVMVLAMCLCIELSFLVIATEPRRLRPDGALWMPVNQMSAAYVKAGIATML